MQLISTNLGGNLHVAAINLNRMGLADFVVALDYCGSGTVVVLRVPDSIAPELRAHLGVPPAYVDNPVPEIDWVSKVARD